MGINYHFKKVSNTTLYELDQFVISNNNNEQIKFAAKHFNDTFKMETYYHWFLCWKKTRACVKFQSDNPCKFQSDNPCKCYLLSMGTA